jgi:hypothetical protein
LQASAGTGKLDVAIPLEKACAEEAQARARTPTTQRTFRASFFMGDEGTCPFFHRGMAAIKQFRPDGYVARS